MDPLALLSNLHGDGPSTLHRLRRNGCDTLSALCSADLADLVQILGWSPERAERFVREADALTRRLGPALLEPEEEGPAEAPSGRAEAPAAPASPAAQKPDAPAPAEPRAHANPRREVLDRWRALDADAPPASDVIVPHARGQAAAAGRALAEAQIDGLDPARLVALQRAGVTTVEDLAAADDLDLHRASGLAFTVVGRLTFLARREAARLGGARCARRSGARPSANGSEAARPGASDVGGPFA